MVPLPRKLTPNEEAWNWVYQCRWEDKKRVSLDAPNPPQIASPEPTEELSNPQIEQILSAAEQLPRPILLVLQGEATIREGARMMNLSKSNFHRRVKEAKLHLRSLAWDKTTLPWDK